MMRGLRTCSIPAVVGAAVALLAAAPPALAYPTQFCQSGIAADVQSVVGGNNLLSGHPGDIQSTLWQRGQGARMTFRVPLQPTVRTDCLGPAAGIGLKFRLIDNNGSGDLTNVRMMAGVVWSNHYTGLAGQGFIYADPLWGWSYGTGHDDDGWDDTVSKATQGLCNLNPGQLVTLRIHNTSINGNHAWRAECRADDGSWINMNVRGDSLSPYWSGVQLVDRWREGTIGGLNLDATGLQWKDLASNWAGWDNANCFTNNTTNPQYRFDGGTSTLSISAGTANPNC
jgi:hypothetical protein